MVQNLHRVKSHVKKSFLCQRAKQIGWWTENKKLNVHDECTSQWNVKIISDSRNNADSYHSVTLDWLCINLCIDHSQSFQTLIIMQFTSALSLNLILYHVLHDIVWSWLKCWIVKIRWFWIFRSSSKPFPESIGSFGFCSICYYF